MGDLENTRLGSEIRAQAGLWRISIKDVEGGGRGQGRGVGDSPLIPARRGFHSKEAHKDFIEA